MWLRWSSALSALAVIVLAGCGKNQADSGTQAASAASADVPASGAAANGASTAAAVTVRIGHAGPLTGSIAHLGKDNENAARLAVEEINTRGLTIDGQRIALELDAQDDAGDPRMGTTVAQKLVDDHVVAVIGHLNSGVSIAASRIYSQAGITQISPSSTDAAYTRQGYKTTYRLVATDAQQGPVLAAYVSDTLHAPSVAIVDDATAYGKGLADAFAAAARAKGVRIVSRDATTDKATDFKGILTRIKARAPAAILYAGMDATGGPFAKQAVALGIRARIVAGDGVCSDKVAELAGGAVDRIVCSQVGVPLANLDQGADFEQKYRARFKLPAESYAPFAYDAVYVLVDAMKRANSVDPTKILAAMPSTDYNGLTGHIAFTANGDLEHGAITLYQFKDRKRSVIDVVKM
jgi:branched-chain amino acid transport system substrate-binding protein